LARLTVSGVGALTYDTKITVGPNPQEIVPVADSNDTYLLVPAIGGMQNGGSSNGVKSIISCVPAYGDWSTTAYPNGVAPVLLTGDASGAYDFKDVAASYRADNSGGVVYILTCINDTGFYSTSWKLYKTTVGVLIGLSNKTIAAAVQDGNLTEVDWATGSPGWFWELLYETGDDDTKDRLWFFRGSAILACPALAYPARPVSVNNPANGSYRYFNFGEKDGQIGGANIDWADLTIETVRQIEAGHSLKRGVRASVPAGAATGGEEE
jgi:hypothetical protein